MTITTFALSSPTTQAAAPFVIGQAFKKGDVPSGSGVAVSGANAQVTAKNAWPDGSLRFAVIAGTASVSTTPATVTLSVGSPSSGTALAIADLKATGITAVIDAGAFGSASWSGADWDTPFQAWISGHRMSSWVYRKQIGADAHLVGWMEVRLFAGGAVEVLPWIENGYLQVASPTNKSATYGFTLGGTSRFSGALDVKHHSRTPLINGTMLSYWTGIDPGVVPRHDSDYLQSTELVPSYSVRRSATGLASLPASYAPFQAGGIIYTDQGYGPDNMRNSGYQRPIGLLGEHDVAYLVCNDQPELLYPAVIRNGFSAGRYPIHYRDEATNRAPLTTAYQNLTVDNPSVASIGAGNNTTPAPTGGAVAIWDGAHHPSLGYMAYLISGTFYHLETVQLIATGNYYTINHFNSRANSYGRLIPDYGSVQTRSAVWGMRTMAQALCVTPDDDTALRDAFRATVETVINYYHATFVAQANNPFGIVEPGETYDEYGLADGTQHVAIWQQDFFTSVYGYMLAMELPIASAVATKLSAFFQWKAKSVVGRLGTSDGFGFENAAVYHMAVGTVGLPNYQNGSGPWLADWQAVETSTFLTPPSPDWRSTTPNLLGGEYTSDVWPKSMWGNLHPAIAYAVRHNVPGAQAAYDRLQGASNYSVVASGFDTSPVWSVKPAAATATVVNAAISKTYTVASGKTVYAGRSAPATPPPSGVLPTWLAGKSLNQAFVIPGSSGAGGAPMHVWGGYAVRLDTNELFCVLNGGHDDSYDNRVTSINLSNDAPAWVLRSDPTPFAQVTPRTNYYADGKPTSRHNYDYTHWVPQANRIIIVGSPGGYAGGMGSAEVTATDGFNPDTNAWDASGTWPFTGGVGYGLAVDHVHGHIWTNGFRRYNTQNKSYDLIVTGAGVAPIRYPTVYDSTRDQMFCLMWGDGGPTGVSSVLSASRFPTSGVGQYTITFNASSAYTQFLSEWAEGDYAGMTYDSINDQFYWYSGQTGTENHLYIIKPNNGNVWDMSSFSFASGSASLPTTHPAGLNGRIKYLPNLKGFIVCPTGTGDIYFVRTA